MSNILALASGQQHAAALIEDGTVLAWGNNDYDQTNVPGNATNVVAIACGSDHTIALLTNGTIIAWGRNEDHATEVPGDLGNVVAIAAGGTHNLALQMNGNLRAWGMDVGEIPASLTDVTAIAAGLDFNLALKADGTVVAWGGGTNYMSRTNVPAGLSNLVAISAGDFHGLALKSDGTVISWGDDTLGQTNAPSDLTNAMAVAAGSLFSMALRNDGTVVAWGDNTFGQTNVLPGLSAVKSIAAGGSHALAALFSPLVQYPVDVTKDLLLIYNTNSADSAFVKDYYLAHRPMVSAACVLGVGCATTHNAGLSDFTNTVLLPLLNWLQGNPTKHPNYLMLFSGIPNYVVGYGSGSVNLYDNFPGVKPFVTCINMTNVGDCTNYISKLEFFATNYSPGQLFISPSSAGYSNNNFYFDDSVEFIPYLIAQARDAVLANGASPSVMTFAAPGSPHITNGVNVAGYLSFGTHGWQALNFATNGTTIFTGDSGWYIMGTDESWNGMWDSVSAGQSTYTTWFSSSAFGGTNSSRTPVGAVCHVFEPGSMGNHVSLYYGLWQAGKTFAICATYSRGSPQVQAVGDPFVRR
jgi:hypothetical protein